MTDLALQEAIINEIRRLTEQHSLKKADGEDWKDYAIYRQDKPYKDDMDDAAQEDYIIVMLDEEDINSEGRWVVTVHIIISIMLPEDEQYGNLVLANLMNQLDLHFWTKRIIDNRYEMERERHKRFNHECYPNYFECDYITKWEMPEMNKRGIG